MLNHCQRNKIQKKKVKLEVEALSAEILETPLAAASGAVPVLPVSSGVFSAVDTDPMFAG